MVVFLDGTGRVIEVALAIFTGIVIAAVSSWITVQLSLRRFRSERWWERKTEAYQRIIEALHDSKVCADRNFEETISGKEITESERKELNRRAKVAYEEIAKATDIGAFLLSSEAHVRLLQYLSESVKAFQEAITGVVDFTHYLHADLAATNTCLEDLIQIAKRDLKAK